MSLLWDVVNHCATSEKNKANAMSMATAKLGTVVVSALGSKSAKVKVHDFLPYEFEQGNSGITEKTKEAMRWALKNEKLPSIVAGMVGSELV